MEQKKLDGTSVSIEFIRQGCDPDEIMSAEMANVIPKWRDSTFFRGCHEITQDMADEYYESEFDREQGED